MTGALLLDDGRLAIGLRSGPEVRLYDTTGQLVRTIGRQGSGPGELRTLAGPWPAGNGVFSVYDLRQRRLTLFDTAGALLGSASVRPEGVADSALVPFQAVNGATDGRLLMEAMRTSDERVTGTSRAPVTFVAVDSTGTVTPVGGPYPGLETFIGMPDAQGRSRLGRPLFARATLAAACGDVVAIADNGAYDIRLVGADGRVRTIVRATVAADVATDDDLRGFLAAQSGGQLPVTEAMLANAREMQTNERLPVLHRLSCDAGDHLWVQEFARPAAATRRVASYALDGALRGTVRLAARDSLLHVRGDRVVIATTGADDVEIVEVRRLLSPPRR